MFHPVQIVVRHAALSNNNNNNNNNNNRSQLFICGDHACRLVNY